MEVHGRLYDWGPFTPGKVYRYPLGCRLDGPQRWCRRFEEENSLLFLSVFEPETAQPVAYSLCRLGYRGPQLIIYNTD
jgi:hypothetical protein